ncbi:hypothetical protein TSUD_339770 [Trifolium subterraneum]|nr:hypothetical protein TSUD_339770 [Trifolium subterraneum]
MLGIVGGGGVVGVSSGSSKRTMVDDGQHGVEEWRQRADPRKAVATSPRGEAMVRCAQV